VLEAVRQAFASRDREDWIRTLADVDACVEPVLEVEEAVVTAGQIRTVASPIRLSGTPVSTPRRPAAALGVDTSEILEEYGYQGDEIARMRDAGVVQ
jgi:alpha-methylacyl-CoA racemase